MNEVLSSSSLYLPQINDGNWITAASHWPCLEFSSILQGKNMEQKYIRSSYAKKNKIKNKKRSLPNEQEEIGIGKNSNFTHV